LKTFELDELELEKKVAFVDDIELKKIDGRSWTPNERFKLSIISRIQGNLLPT